MNIEVGPGGFERRIGNLRFPGVSVSQIPPFQLLHDSFLPATRQIINQQEFLRNVRILILQHALRDTANFIALLKAHGATVETFIAKPNSIDPAAIACIERQSVNVLMEPPNTIPYDYFERTTVLGDTIRAEIAQAKAAGKKLALLDVGGYFRLPLTNLEPEYAEHYPWCC